MSFFQNILMTVFAPICFFIVMLTTLTPDYFFRKAVPNALFSFRVAF